ncbi:MAG: J domain-containing protein [Desulfobacteraceae bacterium]|nr:J domain-containing protein [Desulfobacteraceae bacterium]
MEQTNYFDILGIDSNATMGEIKKAYRKLAFKYHPDHNTGKPGKKKYIQVKKAYEILVDPVKKEEYLKGQTTAVTDEPWTVLKEYWQMIYEKGFCVK